MLFLLLVACTKSGGPATAETPPPARPEAPPAWVGSWTSASCGERSFERLLTLRDDGSATVEDRVSPCPPDVMCMWSGIVVMEGTWKPNGATATVEASDPSGRTPAPPPTLLTWDRAPVDGACRYTEAP